ncbi:MAG: acyl carrier protein [bacterium]
MSKMCIEDRLKGVFVKIIGLKENEWHHNTSLKDDLGIDSTEMVDIVVGIEKEFGLNIYSDDSDDFVTVRDIIEYIKQKLNNEKA